MNLLHFAQATASAFALLSFLLLMLIILMRFENSRRMTRREEFRKVALPHLCAYLAGKEGREGVLSVLGGERKIALELLMEQSDRMDPEARKKLAPVFTGLSYLGGMLRDLDCRQWPSRLRAAERLGYLEEESSIPPLMQALGDEILDVRLAAALSLARLGCTGAVIPIMRGLDLPGEISQRRIAEILAVLGTDAEEHLLKILNDRSSGSAALCIVARTAGLLHLRKAVTPLERLTGHSDEEVRINAVRSLASLGDQSSAKSIAARRDDSSWEVRSAVVNALGRLKDRGSIPLLTESLGDPEWWVRYHAGDSLRHLGEEGMEALREAATGHADAFARDMSKELLEESHNQDSKEATL